MKVIPENINDLTEIIAASFRTFGGGHVTPGNPISQALKDKEPQFAAGVDVKEVVTAVLTLAEKHNICLSNRIADKI